MKKNQSIKEIQRKWEEIIDIFRQNFDIAKYRIQTQTDKDRLYKIEVVEKGKKNTSCPFVIKYKDQGKEIVLHSGKRKGAKILATFISWAGVESVFNLKIEAKRSGFLILSNIQGHNEKDFVPIGNKFVFTKSENEEKINQIREIINRLHLNASVDKDKIS